MRNLKQKIINKIATINASVTSVAKGFACGVAISFTPFVGFHALLAVLTAMAIKANVLAAVLATTFGNPWTFPLIWFLIFYCGKFLLELLNVNVALTYHVDFEMFFEKLYDSLKTWNFSAFEQEIWPVLFPMLIGCVPFYIISWIISFYAIKHLLESLKSDKKK